MQYYRTFLDNNYRRDFIRDPDSYHTQCKTFQIENIASRCLSKLYQSVLKIFIISAYIWNWISKNVTNIKIVTIIFILFFYNVIRWLSTDDHCYWWATSSQFNNKGKLTVQ